MPALRKEDIKGALLDDKGELDSVLASANNLLRCCFGSKVNPKKKIPRDELWPGLKSGRVTPNPHLVLWPLDRVGSEPGFGGSKVLIAHFRDEQRKEAPKSRLMVLKIRRGGAKDDLPNEYSQAKKVRKYVNFNPCAFAFPMYFNRASEIAKGLDKQKQACSVLWSPFKSYDPLYVVSGQTQPSPTAYDFGRLLRKGQEEQPKKQDPVPEGKPDTNTLVDPKTVIRLTYKFLSTWHCKGFLREQNRRERSNLFDEYTRTGRDYLRGLRSGESTWEDAWGAVQKSGTPPEYWGWHYANPLEVLSTLEKKKTRRKLCFGAVHGDLHPRNIMIAHKTSPCIIDFGWAHHDSHIAKDFVLMECNLRFMFLKPGLSQRALRAMATWMISAKGKDPVFPHGDEKFPNELEEKYCHDRLQLIQALHSEARDRFPKRTDWTLEYVVPLFLTALGFLKPKLLRRCDNQVAACVTVAALADRVNRWLKDTR